MYTHIPSTWVRTYNEEGGHCMQRTRPRPFFSQPVGMTSRDNVSDAIDRRIWARSVPVRQRAMTNRVITFEYASLEDKSDVALPQCCFHTERVYRTGRQSEPMMALKFERDRQLPIQPTQPSSRIQGFDSTERHLWR